MADESLNNSADLIRWLKMLALPTWAKWLLAVVMVVTLGGALALAAWGVLAMHIEVVTAAVTILTVGLPVGLIVVAMVFGDGGAAKLKTLTQLVLRSEIPDALVANLNVRSGYQAFERCHISFDTHGCIADYVLSVDAIDRLGQAARVEPKHFAFKLELNVRKANLVLWLPEKFVQPAKGEANPYASCFFGAEREGYVPNSMPISCSREGYLGAVFIKQLSEDFLLNPAQRLYFAQDLAFFIRGVLSVELQHD